MFTLENAIAIAATGALATAITITGLRTIGLLFQARRERQAWVRRRLGLKEGR